MERRESGRLAGVSEISLFDEDQHPLARASVMDLSMAGVLVAFLPETVTASLPIGQKVRFSFVLPTGEVSGSAEVVRRDMDADELALHLTAVDNERGLPNLLAFLHSVFCGVD
jgi:hypothetical protein